MSLQNDSASTATVRTVSVADSLPLRGRKKAVRLQQDRVAEQNPPGLFNDTFLFSPFSASTDSQPQLFLLKKPHTPSLPLTEIFRGHTLVPVHRSPLQRTQQTPDWLFPLVLVMIGMLTWLRVFYARYFKRMLASLVNMNLANQIIRDENVLLQKATIYLNLLFCLITALFLYLISFRLEWDLDFVGSGIYRYLFFSGLVLAVYLLKFLVLKFCGWLFDLDRELSTYLFTVFLTNNLAGLLIFPIAVAMSFNPALDGQLLTLIGLAIAGAAYAFRLLRGVMIGWSMPNARPLYIIFYLCTLELAPLSILLRLLARA